MAVERPAVPLSLQALAAKYFGPETPAVRVDFGALTHPGKVRANNEDHYAITRRHRTREVLLSNLPDDFLPPMHDDSYAMVVADGLGGESFGQWASMLAADRSTSIGGVVGGMSRSASMIGLGT